jgi:hypothetical protein
MYSVIRTVSVTTLSKYESNGVIVGNLFFKKKEDACNLLRDDYSELTNKFMQTYTEIYHYFDEDLLYIKESNEVDSLKFEIVYEYDDIVAYWKIVEVEEGGNEIE